MSAIPAQRAAARDVDASDIAKATSIKSVYVYEAPVRLWHWINALAMVVLALVACHGKAESTGPANRTAGSNPSRAADCDVSRSTRPRAESVLT